MICTYLCFGIISLSSALLLSTLSFSILNFLHFATLIFITSYSLDCSTKKKQAGGGTRGGHGISKGIKEIAYGISRGY